MNSNQPKDPSEFLLPKLDNNNRQVRPGHAGEWDEQELEALHKVASSLDSPTSGKNQRRVSSIPSMWARPLLMEMALHDKDHPLRDEMAKQWRGMLAAIALAEVRGFDLKAELIDLDAEAEKEPFAKSLLQLIPSPVNSLYTPYDRNPWKDIYIFSWKGKPVGMTTPSTLVCPSEKGDWTGLPWWSKGEWLDVVSKGDLDADEKTQLWLWLDNLEKELHKDNSGSSEAVNIISKLLQDFQGILKISNRNQTLQLSNKNKLSIDLGILKVLNLPISIQPQPSSVQLIPSSGMTGVPELLIIPNPQDITSSWAQPPQKIWIYKETHLGTLKLIDLRERRISWSQQIDWIEAQNLFLPNFFFIKQENALPGGLLPKGSDSLTYENIKITPLIPIQPLLLKYFTPEDLVERIQLEQDGNNLLVHLRLPLSGLSNGKPPQDYEVSKKYEISEENALAAPPVLEIWPDFIAHGWQEYYVFYYDVNQGDNTFQVKLPDPDIKEPPHKFTVQEGVAGFFQTARLNKFPSYVVCQSKSGIAQGIILIRKLLNAETLNQGKWTVGVDFGTSFTNVYVYKEIDRNKGEAVRLVLKDLNVRVTQSGTEDRFGSLIEYFIASGTTDLMTFPLSSVLTIRGSYGKEEELERTITDGRIYIPIDDIKYKPELNWIKTNLKWLTSYPSFTKLFLKQLALQITAQAVKSNVREIQWFISYPLAFSQVDKSGYYGIWQRLIKALEPKTGVIHKFGDINYCTESSAVAQYFCDREGRMLVNTTCIDLGGGTSDISIWQGYELVHQCSIRLGGNALFAQFLEQRKELLMQLFDDINTSDWSGLKEEKFYSKLDVLLRRQGEDWLVNRRRLQEIAENPEFQKLTQLTAIGIAGLYYYVGSLLRTFHELPYLKYKKDEITPVYLGGNGSRLLNWLDNGGEFNPYSEINLLLCEMLKAGSGFTEGRGNTYLSDSPKDEVACGLVFTNTLLKVPNSQQGREPYISGEVCIINGKTIEWQDPFPDDNEIKEFSVLPLERLPKFLDSFHLALQKSKIQSIKPVKSYQINQKNVSLWEETQKKMSDFLQNNISQKTRRGSL